MKSDSNLQVDVTDELAWDPSINHTDLGVIVRDGVVTLTGTLTSLAEKHAAEEAVRRVGGVKGLAVEIDVKLLPQHERSDADIAIAARRALEWSTQVPPDAVMATVEKGYITLTGQVSWAYQRKAAERAVHGLIGVRGVANQVHVKPLVTSGQVEQRIQGALARHAAHDAKHVNVRVQGSQVTLSGRVHSLAERDAICGAAWSSPGVAVVVDDLVVF
jgi:osmotically-inducible protein OsmY